MDIAQLIKQPELLDRETLYDLRSLLALYPYYQTARLLLLQNLYLLHDPAFDEELRRAAIYITDRRVLFALVEAAHYQMKHAATGEQPAAGHKRPAEDRTLSLIDTFLSTIPEDNEADTPKDTQAAPQPHRKPTAADATVDYVAYLLQADADEQADNDTPQAPQLKGQDLIDNFINNESGKIKLKADPEFTPTDQPFAANDNKTPEEGYFTETLAKIYIKQGRYTKALEIIQRLYLNYPKKNAYFADQIRFLEKLILNNKNNK